MIAPRNEASPGGDDRPVSSSDERTGGDPAAGAEQPGSTGFPSLDIEALLTGEGENAVETEAELIPARMLNEFAYCPRLAYLEWIQGEFRDNLDTREGTFGHRNVDQPTRQSFDAPVVRSDGEDEAESGSRVKSSPQIVWPYAD